LWRHLTAAIASPTRRAVTRSSATVVSAVVSVRQSGVYPTHSSNKSEAYPLWCVPREAYPLWCVPREAYPLWCLPYTITIPYDDTTMLHTHLQVDRA